MVEEPVETTADITIGTYKAATYCNTSAWQVPTGMEVYTATYDATEKKVTVTKISENVVPANTGVIVYGEPKTYTATLVSDAAALTESNSLIGTTEDVKMDNTTTYILAKQTNGDKLCFGRLESGQTVPANKAYLTIETNDAKNITIDWNNGETTGINAVESAVENANGAYYTLSGQRTVKPLKGVYIHNGKKYIAK